MGERERDMFIRRECWERDRYIRRESGGRETSISVERALGERESHVYQKREGGLRMERGCVFQGEGG